MCVSASGGSVANNAAVHLLGEAGLLQRLGVVDIVVAEHQNAGLPAVAPLPEEEGVHGSDLDEGPAEDADDRRVARWRSLQIHVVSGADLMMGMGT